MITLVSVGSGVEVAVGGMGGGTSVGGEVTVIMPPKGGFVGSDLRQAGTKIAIHSSEQITPKFILVRIILPSEPQSFISAS